MGFAYGGRTVATTAAGKPKPIEAQMERSDSEERDRFGKGTSLLQRQARVTRLSIPTIGGAHPRPLPIGPTRLPTPRRRKSRSARTQERLMFIFAVAQICFR
jgi:hypothetical protein